MPVTRVRPIGGGYNDPSLNLDFVPDAAGAHQNALQSRGMEIRNALAPRRMELDERSVKIQELAWGVREEALKHKMQPDPVSIDIGEYTLTGLSEAVAAAADKIGQFPDQVESLDQLIPWLAREGVSVERKAPETLKTLKRNTLENDRWFELEIDPVTGKTVNKKPMYRQTETQAETARNRSAVGRLQKKADTDPMGVYRSGIKMNDDSTVFGHPLTGAAVELPPFYKSTGKRASMKVIKQVGEHVDDSIEVYQMLQDPEVQADLSKQDNQGQGIDDVWDSVKGKFSNTLKEWMSQTGIAPNSKTFKVLMHIQRMGSEKRKELLGSAVTETELKSILGWMPRAGDSFGTMTGKITLAAEEGYEDFKRWLDMHKNISNMAPFYDSWGLDRFNMPGKDIESLSRSGMAPPPAPAQAEVPPSPTETVNTPQITQNPLQIRGDDLQGQGLDEETIVEILKKEFPDKLQQSH